MVLADRSGDIEVVEVMGLHAGMDSTVVEAHSRSFEGDLFCSVPPMGLPGCVMHVAREKTRSKEFLL